MVAATHTTSNSKIALSANRGGNLETRLPEKSSAWQHDLTVMHTKSERSLETEVSGLKTTYSQALYLIKNQLFQHGKQISTLRPQITLRHFLEELLAFIKQVETSFINGEEDSIKISASTRKKTVNLVKTQLNILIDKLKANAKTFSDVSNNFKTEKKLAWGLFSKMPEEPRDLLIEIIRFCESIPTKPRVRFSHHQLGLTGRAVIGSEFRNENTDQIRAHVLHQCLEEAERESENYLQYLKDFYGVKDATNLTHLAKAIAGNTYKTAKELVVQELLKYYREIFALNAQDITLDKLVSKLRKGLDYIKTNMKSRDYKLLGINTLEMEHCVESVKGIITNIGKVCSRIRIENFGFLHDLTISKLITDPLLQHWLIKLRCWDGAIESRALFNRILNAF